MIEATADQNQALQFGDLGTAGDIVRCLHKRGWPDAHVVITEIAATAISLERGGLDLSASVDQCVVQLNPETAGIPLYLERIVHP